MFRQIVLCFILLICAFQVHGNSKADELRKSMYEAPDSARAAILVDIAKLFQYDSVDSCMIYAQKAIEKAYGTRQYRAVVDAEKIRFQIAIGKKDYVGATRHQKTILDISLRERYWDLAMESYNAMAQTWLLRNNSAEAVEFLKKGLEIAIDRNNLELQKYFYQALIDSYRKLNKTEDVCKYYPLLMEINRMIDADAYNNRINALQTERETLIAAADEAKNRWQQRSTISKVFHIFALVWAVLASAAFVMAYIWYEYKLKSDILKTKNSLSMKTYEYDSLLRNQENAFLFLTNHVQNNINLLEQNICLFEAEQGNLPTTANSPLNRIFDDIQSLFGFFQNFVILLQAQSGQLKPQMATVNIPQLVNNLLVDFEKIAVTKKIQLVNDVQNNAIIFADERLVDMVLRNTISNAFKFAPAGTGCVTVGAKVGTRIETAEDTEFVEVWIIDDGIGLTPEQAEILFDLTDNLLLPSDPETKGYGLGLAVCRAVIETLNGRIWAETKPDEGFCIRFCLPRTKDIKVTTLGLAENSQDTISIEESIETPLLLSE